MTGYLGPSVQCETNLGPGFYVEAHSFWSPSQCHLKVARKDNLQREEIWFRAVAFPLSEHISELGW